MTTLRVKRLGQAVLGTAATTLYTVPSDTTAVLRNLHLNNIGSTATYTVYFVKAGGSPSVANTVYYAQSLTAATYTQLGHKFAMAPGDTIRALSNTASTIVAQVSGVEATGGFTDATPQRLIQAKLTTSTVTYYTVPTGYRAMLKDFLLCNCDTSDVNVTVDFVLASGSPGNASKFLYAWKVTAGNMKQHRLSAVLEAGDTIRASCDSSIVDISLNVSGTLVEV